MKLSFLDIERECAPARRAAANFGRRWLQHADPLNRRKLRRYRRRFTGVENRRARGSFPATSLADARAERDAARAALEWPPKRLPAQPPKGAAPFAANS